MSEHSSSNNNAASTGSTGSTGSTSTTGGYSRTGSTGGGGYSRTSGSSTGGGYRFNKRRHPRKKVCRFCENKLDIDYKDAKLLKSFLTERGKILPKRATGNCDRHQRQLTRAIKTARTIALIPYGLIVQK